MDEKKLEMPRQSRLSDVLSFNDARLVEHIELSRRRAALWGREFLSISFKEELIERTEGQNIYLKSDPPLHCVNMGTCALRHDGSIEIKHLARWCRHHLKRILAKIKTKPERFKKRTLLVGLMNVEVLPRHPDERKNKLRRLLPVGYDFKV